MTTRRDVLRSGVAVGAGMMLGGVGAAQARPSAVQSAGKTRAIRIAHLTDTHIQPERKADQGVAACLRHVQSLSDKPGLILTGGDTIMDSFEAERGRTQMQWDLWHKTLAGENAIPVKSCIGNHDIWGWNRGKSKTTGNEPQYGKSWAVEALKIPNRYYSFDEAGWHFIVLDSTQPKGDGYEAYLDDEQFEWFAEDVQKTKLPTLVLSHIPIYAACVLAENDNAPKNRKHEASGGLMHIDSRKVRQEFLKQPNVKAAISGHIHLIERVDYDGVTYLCNGAVSGAWWKGQHHRCREGYALIDLYTDGTFSHSYVEYGWKAENEE